MWDNNKFEIIIKTLCQQLSDDIFKKSKTSNSLVDGKDLNSKPVYWDKPSSKSSLSISIPISTKPNKKGTGPTLPKGTVYNKSREYNYDVVLKGAGYSALVANVLLSWRIFVTKGMVWWPLLVAAPATYFYITPLLLQKHSKKLFDMCNVGEEFYLGRKRNEILRKCNQILDTEDFWNLYHPFDPNHLFIIMPSFINLQFNKISWITSINSLN